MTTNKKLLLEMLIIGETYSRRDILDVTSILEGDSETEPLGRILRSLDKLNARRDLRPGSKAKSTRSAFLTELREQNPQMYAFLSQVLSQMMSRELLPEAKDLRRFAETLGVKNLPTQKREQGVWAIARTLADLPLEKARHAIEHDAGPRVEGSREYADLVDTILTRDRRGG